MLAWKRPRSENDIGYIVELRGPSEESYHILDTLSPDLTSYTVFGLQEGVDYEFRVQLVNIRMEEAIAEVVEAVQKITTNGGCASITCILLVVYSISVVAI